MSVIIIGGGLAGLSTAYHLTHNDLIKSITIIEKEEPMKLTSSASTGGHRIFFPLQDSLASMATRSSELFKDLARKSDNIFEYNTRGYVFITDNENEFEKMKKVAENASRQGGGPIRLNEYRESDPFNFEKNPDGFDLVDNQEKIHSAFPFLTKDAKFMHHVRRAGFMNVEALGELLVHSISPKVQIIKGEVLAVAREDDLWSVEYKDNQEKHKLKSDVVVVAMGPFLKRFVMENFGLALPLMNEIHAKAIIDDPLHVFPETSPFMLWNVPTTPYWNEEERKKLETDPKTEWMTKPIPPSDHLRPLSTKETGGKRAFAGIWTYDCPTVDNPVYPIPLDENYGEIVFRGLVNFIPGLKVYFEDPKYDTKNMVKVVSGYYCKTPENMAIIGPLEEKKGIFICGGLSGYGIMQCQAAGELISLYVHNFLSAETKKLPSYSSDFHPSRYLSSDYLEKVKSSNSRNGQL